MHLSESAAAALLFQYLTISVINGKEIAGLEFTVHNGYHKLTLESLWVGMSSKQEEHQTPPLNTKIVKLEISTCIPQQQDYSNVSLQV